MDRSTSVIVVAALGLLAVAFGTHLSSDGGSDPGSVRVVPGKEVSQPPSIEPSFVLPSLPPLGDNGPSLDIDDDPERARTLLGQEQRDLTWAPRAETAVGAVFAAAGWPYPVKVDCRSSGCEISGGLNGIKVSNLQASLEYIAGENVNLKLRAIGLRPDKSPVYTVTSDSPLRISFSRLVSRDFRS